MRSHFRRGTVAVLNVKNCSAQIFSQTMINSKTVTPRQAAIDRGQAALIGEAELDHLALDIPDMRTRLGIRSGPAHDRNVSVATHRVCRPCRGMCAAESAGVGFPSAVLSSSSSSYNPRQHWMARHDLQQTAAKLVRLRRHAATLVHTAVALEQLQAVASPTKLLSQFTNTQVGLCDRCCVLRAGTMSCSGAAGCR